MISSCGKYSRSFIDNFDDLGRDRACRDNSSIEKLRLLETSAKKRTKAFRVAQIRILGNVHCF
jgi:hypothetical protein